MSICPHCGKAIEQEQTVNVFNPLVANGAAPNSYNLVFNNAACANPFSAQALNLSHFTWNNAAQGCNPYPQITYIEF